MKRLSLIIFALLLFPSISSATAQSADKLIYKGKTERIFTNPLESYFDINNPRPEHLFNAICTACYRGYIATWEIIDNHLYLVKLDKNYCGRTNTEIPLNLIFPNKEAPIDANWFSGAIRIPLGKLLHGVRIGYESIYEKDLILKFINGKLISEQIIDNRNKPIPSRQ